MKAAWQSVEDVCGILICILFFGSAVGILPFSLTPQINLTGAAINKMKFVPSGGSLFCTVSPTWDPVSLNISPLSALFVCLVGVCFDLLCVYDLSHKPFRSVISGSEGRHEGE